MSYLGFTVRKPTVNSYFVTRSFQKVVIINELTVTVNKLTILCPAMVLTYNYGNSLQMLNNAKEDPSLFQT